MFLASTLIRTPKNMGEQGHHQPSRKGQRIVETDERAQQGGGDSFVFVCLN